MTFNEESETEVIEASRCYETKAPGFEPHQQLTVLCSSGIDRATARQ